MTKLFLTAALVLSIGGLVRAQAPGTGGPTPIVPDPTAVPLDGGATLLLASGVAYGLRHLRTRGRAAR